VPDRRPLVVEVVGLAGTGKSTLVSLLAKEDDRFCRLAQPSTRRLSSIPFYVKNVVAVLPTFIRMQWSDSPRPGVPELSQMALLAGWRGRLPKTCRPHAVILFDQGPVYMMSFLRAFGPAAFRTAPAEAWLRKMYGRWARSIDYVVWLDADDAVLCRRVRERDRWHPLDEMTDEDARAWMGLFRQTFRDVIAALAEFEGKPKVLTFDAGPERIGRLSNDVRSTLFDLMAHSTAMGKLPDTGEETSGTLPRLA
jgi:hypothetical protein